MIERYYLFNVGSKCVFYDNHIGYVWTLVHAEDEFSAKRIAEEYLLSPKSGYKVKEIDWQELGGSSRFIAENTKISIDFPYV